mmetsp:Transcript_30989/g.36363  ORF Transcript_30989/g.36363 Transcript_30989/m.36363 type:complete len:88 (-) Transcript_30989:564-827(-)
MFELILGFLLRAVDLASDLVVKLLILVELLVLELANLHLDNLGSLLNLEIGDLRAQRLDLVSDLLDQLPSVLRIKLDRTSLHNLNTW